MGGWAEVIISSASGLASLCPLTREVVTSSYEASGPGLAWAGLPSDTFRPPVFASHSPRLAPYPQSDLSPQTSPDPSTDSDTRQLLSSDHFILSIR